MARVVVIGAGAMGLAAAYRLVQEGHDVSVYEAGDRIGGMSAHFDFEGLSIERFYHFICGPDETYFSVLKELGIHDRLQWSETKMSYFYDGAMYRWGNPAALLAFPRLGLISKIRYGLHAFYATKIRNWDALDKVDAVSWIRKWIGDRAYRVLWQKLFDLKFFQYTSNMSAAWIGTRIKRVGLSRKNIFTERMGYLEGGSDVLFAALADAIVSRGGKIHLKKKVSSVTVSRGKVSGIICGAKTIKADHVISTVPLPYVPKLIPGLPKLQKQQYAAVKNIPVVCVITKLSRAVTDNFWLNINDPRIRIPGLIEYSNLNSTLPCHVVYAPYYMPDSHPDYRKPDSYFIQETRKYLKIVNPSISDIEIEAMKVFRYEYAQPICPPGYLSGLPAISPGVTGLYVADTSYYYPEDRSISESMRVGLEIAAMIGVK